MHAVRARYSHIARYYDVVYRFFLARGSRVLVNLRKIEPEERVLEVGLGTGFSLRHYPADVRVTGMDLCPEMLAVAARKVPSSRAHIDIVPMDAHTLGFVDDVFDVILFPHSLGLMDDPLRVLAEVARVSRPGAELRILHTFEWANPVLNRIETALYDAFENRLGWGRPLEYARTVKWCRKNGFEVVFERKFGWKTILAFRKI